MIKGRAIETGVLGLVLVKKSTSLLKLAVLVRRFDVGKSLFLETRFVRLRFFFIVPPPPHLALPSTAGRLTCLSCSPSVFCHSVFLEGPRGGDCSGPF